MSAARGRITPDRWALGAIALAVLVANGPYLLGLFDPNPLDFRSGLTGALTPGLLGGRPTIDPSNGFTSQAIGHLAALDLLHLRLPWWNPFEGTGMALAGETQAAALFPPTLLTAFSNGQLYEHVLLELVAGICTYLLLRRLGVARLAATAGAIAYALNGKFAWFADATVNPLPFLPMLLLGIERAYASTHTGRPGGWRLLALAGALSVYAGFPEVAYIDTVMAACWLGWRCGCLERRLIRPFLARAALGALAGTLIAGPMLLAMGTYLTHADLVVHANSQLGSRHLGFSAVPQLLMPYIFGQVNTDPRASIWIMVGGYLSVTLLLFAALGLAAPGRHGLKLVLGGWALLVFARIYGEPPLLGHVVGVLPGMSRIQFYRYGTAALELPVIILAALGLDDLARVPAHRRRLLWAALTTIAIVIAVAFYARPLVHALGSKSVHGAYFRGSLLWAVAIVAGVGTLAFVRPARARATLLVLLIAVDAVGLFALPEFAAPRSATVDLTPVAYLRGHLGEGRFYTLGPIQPDYGSYFGLASLGVDDFPPRAYSDYVHARVDPGMPLIGFRPANQPSAEWELLHHLAGYRSAGVRYVLTPAAGPLPSNRALRLVFHSSSTRIYRLAGAAAYFSARACRVGSGERTSATVVCPGPATLVRRETWFPGWTAQLDDHPASIHRIDGLFQAVEVPAGSHRVTFSYTPPGMGWAALGLTAGFTLMLSVPLASRARRSRPAAGPRRLARPQRPTR